MFGAPNTGVHSLRIADLAVVDFALTALIALAISFYFKLAFYIVFIALFLVGEMLHMAFGVDTTIIRWCNLHIDNT
jgi:hypothetical protein